MTNEKLIHFTVFCRLCMTSEKVEYTIQTDDEIFRQVSARTEFEAIKYLEYLGAFEDYLCNKCLSSNLITYRLKINDEYLYNKNDLKSCTGSKLGFYLKFERIGQKFKKSFLKSRNFDLQNDMNKWIVSVMIKHLLEDVHKQPIDETISSIVGIMSIMIFGNVHEAGVETEINRYYSAGISESEINQLLFEFSKEHSIPFHSERYFKTITNNSKLISNICQLDSVNFYGAILTEHFNVQIIDYEKLGLSKYNLCITLGEDVVALKIPLHLTPDEFYHQIKYDVFYVDKNTQSIPYFSKNVYYASRR